MLITAKELQGIGLTETESKIYFLLLEKKEQTQASIAQALGVAVNRVSTVLKAMFENKIIGSRKINKVGYYYITSYDDLKRYVEGKHEKMLLELNEKLEDQKVEIEKVFSNLSQTYESSGFIVTHLNSDEEVEEFRQKIVLPLFSKEVFILNNLDLFKKNISTDRAHKQDNKKIDTKISAIYVTSKINNAINKNELNISSDVLSNIKTSISVFEDYVTIGDITSPSKNVISIKNRAFADTMLCVLSFIKKTLQR